MLTIKSLVAGKPCPSQLTQISAPSKSLLETNIRGSSDEHGNGRSGESHHEPTTWRKEKRSFNASSESDSLNKNSSGIAKTGHKTYGALVKMQKHFFSSTAAFTTCVCNARTESIKKPGGDLIATTLKERLWILSALGCKAEITKIKREVLVSH